MYWQRFILQGSVAALVGRGGFTLYCSFEIRFDVAYVLILW